MERSEMVETLQKKGVWSNALPWLNDVDLEVMYHYWCSLGKPEQVQLSWNAGKPKLIKKYSET